jgi:hypothetical protein
MKYCCDYFEMICKTYPKRGVSVVTRENLATCAVRNSGSNPNNGFASFCSSRRWWKALKNLLKKLNVLVFTENLSKRTNRHFGKPTFVLLFLSVDLRDEKVLKKIEESGHPIPYPIVTERIITYCPWCGRNLSRFYKKTWKNLMKNTTMDIVFERKDGESVTLI